MSVRVYDKVSWHYPDGEGCASLEGALLHFRAILAWLGTNELLSPLGEELAKFAMDGDTALTSDMLSELGNRIMSESYDVWLEQVDYSSAPSLALMDRALERASQDKRAPD